MTQAFSLDNRGIYTGNRIPLNPIPYVFTKENWTCLEGHKEFRRNGCKDSTVLIYLYVQGLYHKWKWKYWRHFNIIEQLGLEKRKKENRDECFLPKFGILRKVKIILHSWKFQKPNRVDTNSELPLSVKSKKRNFSWELKKKNWFKATEETAIHNSTSLHRRYQDRLMNKFCQN